MGEIVTILLLVIMVLLLWLVSKISKVKSQNQALLAELNKATADNLSKQELEMGLNQLANNFSGQMQLLNQQVNQLSGSNEGRMEAIRATMANELQQLRLENGKTLEEMRQTVDVKLQATLERRLGESFNQVGQRLEQVHQGLGEMQTLAAGVGDLQKLLRNVKIRGTWGEVQLGAILEQMLVKDQYQANVAVDPNSAERVEYALILPQEDGGKLWLPIDAKCPIEDYQRLVAAEEAGNTAQKNQAANALAKQVLAEGKDICEKYIVAPYTTDFAIMFLPMEGLYAEVLQHQSLCDDLQRQYRVLVAGPTTLAALLNVLQLGYKSLAIQERAGEVWELLGHVKQEFNNFGAALAKSQKKIQEAGNALEMTSRRTRVMERKLKAVENRAKSQGDLPDLAGDLSEAADADADASERE